MQGKKSFVYLMYAPLTKLIKIGKSDNPDRRRADIELQSGMEIWLLAQIPCRSATDAFALEGRLHNEFAEYRAEFGEWFKLGGCISDWVKDVVRDRWDIPDEWMEPFDEYLMGLGQSPPVTWIRSVRRAAPEQELLVGGL